MKNKDFFNNLKSLNQVKPDNSWKESNRAALLMELNKTKDAEELSFFKKFNQALSIQVLQMSQPAIAASMIMLFLLGGSFYGVQVSQDTKPGDTLYTAKIFGEKTQQVFTFNDKRRVQLGITFASNRMREIDQLMSEAGNEAETTPKVEKLITSFKKEIKVAKNISKKMVPEKPELEVVEPTEEEPVEVFSAGFAKKEIGLQISMNDDGEQATSTEESIQEEESKAPQLMLLEAEKMIEDENYEEVLDTLEKLENEINLDNFNSEKDETEKATSTEGELPVVELDNQGAEKDSSSK